MKRILLLCLVLGLTLPTPPPANAADRPVHQGSVPTQPREGPRTVPVDDPPTGTVVSYPEWAPADRVFVAWMWSSFYPYLADLVEGVVDAGVTCHIAVTSAGMQSTAETYLTNQGISLERVEFLITPLDTLWIIDYGPFFVTVDGVREVIDHEYGWPLDDDFPLTVATEWSMMSYGTDLEIEGGNFIADGLGTCFITERVFEANAPGLSEQDVRDRLREFCGCDTVHALDYLADYTGHIDMFAKLLDEETMLVGELPVGDVEHLLLEGVAAEVATLTAPSGNPYQVVRIPIIRVPVSGQPDTYQTYTNSLLVDGTVLVPVYGEPEDVEALQVYTDALPGWSVVGIDSTVPIEWGGAVHCTSKIMPVEVPPGTPTPSPTGPTTTPTVEPTATEPPPTATVPPSSTPTPAPTVTPEPTTTPTPTPRPLGVRIEMPFMVHPGDPFEVTGLLDNPGPDPRPDQPVCFVLEAPGGFWFWPSWCRYAPPDSMDFDLDLLPMPVGTVSVAVIESMIWPDTGQEAMTGLRFYGALLTPDLAALEGGLAISEWGFGPAVAASGT